ncbi:MULTISPECIES: Scr1 family TA system antitoxin-like transcriptional regulator [unclassified Streptomyces]|uniref:Scr1 family TA system antitoxin-like transcriptional regulator n=1 Tax=unclassified Streptomyces TaxID=2593676 RepID=UPI003641BEA8
MTAPDQGCGAPGTHARHALFVTAETEARETWEFQPAYVLSSLRTIAYAHAEASAAGRPSAPDETKRRIARQRLLADTGRQFKFLMTEGALRWQLGSAQVMREQIDHLLALNRRPNIEVGIIPWRRPVQVTAGHAFHIYDQGLVVVGTAHTVLRTSAAADIRTYRELYRKLEQHAAHGTEADNEMRRIRDEFHALEGASA